MTHSQTPCDSRDLPTQDAGLEAQETSPQDAQEPSSWSGRLSGADFARHYENNSYVLSVKVEAEQPVLLQDIYAAPAEIEVHAMLMDLALAFARGDDLDADDIRKNAMGLSYAADVFGQSGKNLKSSLDRNQKKIEISPKSQHQIKTSYKSAEVLLRISGRIETRLRNMLGDETFSQLISIPQKYTTHQSRLLN